MNSLPLAAVTDSVVLARSVMGCLMPRRGETGRKVAARGVDLLRNARPVILADKEGIYCGA